MLVGGGHSIENENVKLVYVECLIIWKLPFGQVGKKSNHSSDQNNW